MTLTAADIARRCKRPGQTGPRQWQACCPAHEDSSPSLSIGDGDKGLVIHCHAGCEPEAVLAALGLSWADLKSTPGGPTTEAVYPYTDAEGFTLYEVVRQRLPDGSKTFRQRAGDWESTGRWSVKGIPPVPYRLPEVRAADEVWVVEGEKDADRLAGLGLAATCNSGGAGSWRAAFREHFHRKRVYVIPDADDPGLQHAVAVAESLRSAAASVDIVHLPGAAPQSDVSDWLDGGHSLADLLALRSRPPAQPAGAGEFKAVEIDPNHRPRRQWLMGTSHLRGVVSLLVARGGTGKSAMLVAEALALATGRGEEIIGEHVPEPCKVASIVLEDDWHEYHRRLEAAIIHHRIYPEELGGRLVVTCDHRARFGSGEGGASPGLEAWLYHQCTTQGIDVLQIDPWVNALAGSENDNVEIARIAEGLTDLARAANICIRVAHHVRKSGAEATGDDARGASALLNAARVVQVLNSGMAEAVAAGADEPDARRVIRLDHDKANLSERQAGRYFQLRGVYLDNGPAGGDSAAVTVPYQLPDPARDVPEADLSACVAACVNGLPESPRSAMWAGRTFAPLLGIDVSSDAGRARMRKIIAQWVDRGQLKLVSEGGRKAPLLYPGESGYIMPPHVAADGGPDEF